MKKIKKVWVIALAIGIIGAILVGFFYPRTLPKELEQKPIDLEAIKKEVEEIRGLKFKEPIEHKTMGRNDVRPYLLSKLKEGDIEDLSNLGKLLIALHLWNESRSFKDSYLDDLTNGAGGFYDTDTKAFYEILEGDEPIAWRKVICAHELTHALQDQNFPEVFELMEANETSGDEILALQSLIEGDATFTQEAYMISKLTQEEMGELLNYSIRITEEIKMDPLIEKIMLFPYLKGAKFVLDLYMIGDIKEINKAFRNLPTTTEQIMHPKKYFEGINGSEVTLPNMMVSLQKDWTKIDEDVFGEAMIYLILGKYLSEQGARSSAGGWNGDRYVYYESESNYLLIAKLNWDSRKDALEFYNSWYDFTKAWSTNQSLKLINIPLLQSNFPFRPRHRSLKVGDIYVFLKILKNETAIIETQDLNILKKVVKKI
jgi:hypothetical protein